MCRGLREPLKEDGDAAAACIVCTSHTHERDVLTLTHVHADIVKDAFEYICIYTHTHDGGGAAITRHFCRAHAIIRAIIIVSVHNEGPALSLSDNNE